jgi:predicted MPP superfamily phosphohydrolase
MDSQDSPVRLSRRKILQFAGAGAVSLAAGTAGYGFLWEPSNLEVTRTTVAIDDLPAPFEGFKIAVLSDFHWGIAMTEDFALRAVAAANALDPDITVVPGDFVHVGFTGDQGELGRIISTIKAKQGVYGTLGNHDHWAKMRVMLKALEDQTPIRILMNEKVLLEKGGEAIALCGTDDLRFGTYLPERALGGIPPDMPRILLQHQPDSAEELDPGWRVDLQISGHMHGGQIAFLRGVPGYLPSRYGTKFVEGLVQGRSHRVFVTRGVGGHLPGRPRMFCRPEVSLIVLKSRSSTI